MLVLLEESFFNQVQALVVEPAFDLLRQTTFEDIEDIVIPVGGEGASITVSLFEIKLPVLKVDTDTSYQMVRLSDESIQLSIRGFSGRLQMAYRYLSDPPLLADIGEIEVDIQNLDLLLEVQTFTDEDGLL